MADDTAGFTDPDETEVFDQMFDDSSSATDDVDDDEDFDTDMESSPPSSGGNRLAKAFSDVQSKLSFAAGGGSSGAAQGRLSSVVNESTPAAAFSLLRENTNFAFPGLNAYLVLVLPTRGDFGGLSSRSRNDEEKGTIINLITADNIHVIVTEELLTDDALAIIPDTETLQRMGEISLLTQARYVYAVACEDVETQHVKIFAVPPSQQKDAVDGRLFEQIEAIHSGSFRLSAVVDVDLVKTMLQIYRSPDNADSAGKVLDELVEANSMLLVDAVAHKRYPNGQELIDNLTQRFVPAAPAANNSGRHRAAGAAPGGAAPAVKPATPAANTKSGQPETAEPVQSAAQSYPEATPDAPAVDDSSTDDNSGESSTDEGAFFESGPPAAAPAEVVGVDQPALTALHAEILEALSEIKASAASGVRTTESGVRIDDGVGRSAPIEVPPGSEFTYDQAIEAVGRNYINDDLGLSVDERPFSLRLRAPLRTIAVPESEYTPWLGEQIQALVSMVNGQLETLHSSNESLLYNQYMRLADMAAADIAKFYDPKQNPDSDWGVAAAAIEADKEAMTKSVSEARLKAEEAVRATWKIREDQAANNAAAKARQDFAHRSAAKIEIDIRDAGNRVLTDMELRNNQNLAELNNNRRIAAQQSMDERISSILDTLTSKFTDQQKQENEAFEAGLVQINDYIDKHRINDIENARITARQLESDARYAQLEEEATRSIDRVRAESEERIKQMRADADARAKEHHSQMDIVQSTATLKLNAAASRNELLEEQVATLRSDHASELADQQRINDNRFNEVVSSREEMRIAMEAQRNRDSRLALGAIVMVVVGAITLVAVGLLVGVFVL